MQRIYAGRRDRLLEGLKSGCAAWLDPVPSAAGLHIAAVFGKAVDDAALVVEARKLGVRVHALGAHYVRRPGRRGLLFGYGAIEENVIAEGLTRLRRALRLVDASL
jgi:GntR family transcriptional regulator/MocR family aminotransferase